MISKLKNIDWNIMKDAFIMFLIQLVNYALLVVNYRAVAHASYFWGAVSDFVVASFSFFVIKKIAKSSDTVALWLGYAIGGMIGSIIGIWLSLQIHGH